ncbi:hypothetical protein H5410_013739 [Solanum commersonii]|uniref:Uncharacterized protein n=1 Tax=Solanum commersonii TaxID=4109 RepID=A0A9J5ZP79_SOLCO|nr:hypothetical protein H5410_013739 [Solanum commersonii]
MRKDQRHFRSIRGGFQPSSISIDVSANSLLMRKKEIVPFVPSRPSKHIVKKGEIPKSIRNLVELEEFDVGFNSFSGSLPTEMFSISALRIMSLSFNNISGTLPPNIGSTLPNIEDLYMGRLTNLVGTITHSISNCSKLTNLELSQNKLTGYLTHLNFLNLRRNNLTSDSILSFLTSLTHCRNLRFLSLAFNPLNGMLPVSIGNFSKSLVTFYAAACKINGQIPNEV